MKRIIIVPALALLMLFALWGCDNDTSNGPVDPGGGDVPPEKSCLGCHEDKTKFCDKCHTYASVNPYCWDCHTNPKEIK